MQIRTTKYYHLFPIVLLAAGMNLRAADVTTPTPKPNSNTNPIPTRRAAQAPPANKARVTPKAVTAKALTSTNISEVIAQNITVSAGTSMQIFAQSDFTGADVVNLSVYAASDQDLSNTQFEIWWAFPGMPYYTASSIISGKDFVFLNSGSSGVYPFGNELLIYVDNNGMSDVTITQITAYATAR